MSFKKILFRFTIFIPKFIKKIKYNYLYRLWNLLIVKDHKSELFIGGITIGEGVIIQTGSVVVNDIEDFAIVGGSPAKKFKSRDIEHYIKLKNSKKFH